MFSGCIKADENPFRAAVGLAIEPVAGVWVIGARLYMRLEMGGEG
jgi:hypothetical protein